MYLTLSITKSACELITSSLKDILLYLVLFTLPLSLVGAEEWRIYHSMGAPRTKDPFIELTGSSAVGIAEEFCLEYIDWISGGDYTTSYHHSGTYYDSSRPASVYDLSYVFGCHGERASERKNTWHSFLPFHATRVAEPPGPSGPQGLGGCPGKGIPDSLTMNPIHAGTGNKYQVEKDYSDGGKNLLSFIRYYNSSSAQYPESTMGNGWMHIFERRVLRKSNNYVTVIRPDGKGHVWENTGVSIPRQSRGL